MAVERALAGPRVSRGRITCSVCGIAKGNSRGIPVHRYPLRRTFYRKLEDALVGRTLTVASIALCDACIPDLAVAPRSYRKEEAVPA